MQTLVEDANDQVPEWVHWIAQDRDGAWWGFEVEPNEGAESWYENEVGRYVRLGKGRANPYWREALYCYPPESTERSGLTD